MIAFVTLETVQGREITINLAHVVEMWDWEVSDGRPVCAIRLCDEPGSPVYVFGRRFGLELQFNRAIAGVMSGARPAER